MRNAHPKRSLLADGDLASAAVSLAADALGDLLDLAAALQEGSNLRLDGLAGFHGWGGFADFAGGRLHAQGGHDLDLFQKGGRPLCLKQPLSAWLIAPVNSIRLRLASFSRQLMACFPVTYTTIRPAVDSLRRRPGRGLTRVEWPAVLVR